MFIINLCECEVKQLFEVMNMLKKIIIFDMLVGVSGGIAIKLIFNAYAAQFLIGLFLGAIVFIISGLITGNILINNQKNRGVLLVINFFKVLFICIIGTIIFNNNINNVISYSMGFTAHLIALLLYSLFNLRQKRK